MKLLTLALSLMFAIVAQADDEADRVLGVWATDKAEAHVEISRDDGGYYGTIVWLKEPFFAADDEHGMAGQPKTDRENPDPGLRDRPILGLRIVNGFQYDGDLQWADGSIYDPANGKTYRCKLWLTREGTLKVRGYVGVSLFGRTTEWTRVLARPVPAGEAHTR